MQNLIQTNISTYDSWKSINYMKLTLIFDMNSSDWGETYGLNMNSIKKAAVSLHRANCDQSPISRRADIWLIWSQEQNNTHIPADTNTHIQSQA